MYPEYLPPKSYLNNFGARVFNLFSKGFGFANDNPVISLFNFFPSVDAVGGSFFGFGTICIPDELGLSGSFLPLATGKSSPTSTLASGSTI